MFPAAVAANRSVRDSRHHPWLQRRGSSRSPPIPRKRTGRGLDPNTVVATVGGNPVYERQVELLFLATTHGQAVPVEAVPRMRAAILLQLVNRQIAESYLAQAKLAATPEEIDAELLHLKTELEHAKKTMADYLARSHQTETTLRSEIAWGLSWKKFLKQQITDETLEAYFKAHQRDFDGTELRVSHILLRPTDAGDDSTAATLVKEAEAGFASKSRPAKSRSRPRRRSIPPAQAGIAAAIWVHPAAWIDGRAIYARRVRARQGQISPPVATVFGIHLIRVTDIKPGDKKWSDVRGELQTAIDVQLFEQLVAHQRDKVSVQYSGKAPYFKPGTTELVVPK